MTKAKSIKEARENINPDIVYQELYEEMRRYRDYELTSSTWFMVILLATISGIITLKFGDHSNFDLLTCNFLFKVISSFLCTLIALSGILSAIFAACRYNHLRDWVTKNFEPDWKKYKPKDIKFLKPIWLIVTTQVTLWIISLFLIWANK